MLISLLLPLVFQHTGSSIAETKSATESTTESTTESPAAKTTTAQSEEETTSTYVEKTFVLTAYCPCVKCCDKNDGITATGTKATAGRTLAVDPSVIPYGTEIIINGNTYVAEDCGGAIKGNKIDVFFDTHAEALQFGRQVMTVYILY